MNNLPILNIIFVIGGPGSGKGSQCAKIALEKGLIHLSTGDLLRDITKDKSNNNCLAKEINILTSKGELISSELMMKVLNKKLKTFTKDSVILLDGFPRNKDNLTVWKKDKLSNVKLPMVWYFNCPDWLLSQRILHRNNEGRNDSRDEIVKKRIQIYKDETEPVIEELRSHKGFKEIDLTKSIEEVDKLLCEILKENNLL